ncbi:hypothetical protein [Mariniluteicoccus flavus]
MSPTWWTSRRKRLAAWSAPVWIAAVLTSGTLIGKTVDNAAGREAYAESDMATAREKFERTHRVNVVQPWVAAYNRGTANHGLRNYPAAKTDFAEALKTVPKAQDCLVRLNLVATIEVMGDELAVARRHAEAETMYAEGLAVLRQGQCGDPTRKPSASPSPSPSGTKSPTPGKSGQPTTGPSGQPTSGPSGEPTTGPSGQPTEGKPSSQPTAGEEQRKEEQERAGESEDRMEEKRREEQKAKEREQRSSKSPTPQPSGEPNPEPPDQRIERVEKQNEEARKQQQKSRDREKRSGTDVERPW